MALEATGRVFSSGQANTLYVSIPSVVVTDSAFPFEEGETVQVSIDNGGIRITSGDDPTDEPDESTDPSSP